MIHEFYSREATNPIHLTVDTGFRNGDATIKGFVSISLSLGDHQLAAQFQEIPLDLRMVEAERIGCMYLLKLPYLWGLLSLSQKKKNTKNTHTHTHIHIQMILSWLRLGGALLIS